MVQCSRIDEDEQAKRKRGERRSVADPTKKTPIVCKRLSEESTASIVESQAGEDQGAATSQNLRIYAVHREGWIAMFIHIPDDAQARICW